jgi:tRNA pseudouridine55 synthase
MTFGLLNIDKPAGWTSRDVVNRVERLVRPAKVGHAGTLDPLATGVLVVCVGPATRLVPYVQEQAKQYEAAFLLGRTSDTEDIEGRVEDLAQPPVPTRDQIEQALPTFLGTIEQQPPSFSALRVRGKRAYALARAGEAIPLAARKVRIDRLQLREYDYPQMRLSVLCGSGTYIRSLGRDVARAVGTSAVMSELCRTAVGPFRLEDSTSLEALTAGGVEQQLLPPAAAVGHLARVVLDDDGTRELRHGTLLELPCDRSLPDVAAFDSQGRLVAVLSPHAAGRWKPHCNFAPLL